MAREPYQRWRGVFLAVLLIAGGLFALAAWLLLTFVEPRFLAWLALIGLFDLAGALGGLALAGRSRPPLRDPATGLYNRRHLDADLKREVERASRYRRSLAVLTIAASNTGDEELDSLNLRSLGGVLLAFTRASDTPCRSGLSEFTLVLPETDATGATVLGRRICDLLERRARAGTLPVRAHVGIAAFPTFGGPDELLNAASRAAAYARSQDIALAVAPVDASEAGASS